MTRDERLNELVSIVNGIRWGMPGYDRRLVEMGSGFPAGGSGGGSKGSHADPTQRMGLEAWEDSLKPKDQRKADPAAEAQSDFDRRLEAALREAERLWDEYKRIGSPRLGVSKINDPGCELCNAVPDHWCQTFATVERTSPAKRKGAAPTTRKVRLCSWCYQFARPDRADRLPDHDEVSLHAQGKRVRWKVGA